MAYGAFGEFPIRRAGTLPMRGSITCSRCGKTWKDTGDHFIRRMVEAGWKVSADAPHNLCPSCVRQEEVAAALPVGEGAS